ncbi:hypothetical protein BGZ95_002781 [Linnemannia exigua]|uniref:Uncharacterized protein n=1 Tax=Linnemannia exigua TaxID=604196 RepID=A0AAD4H355_9FUNG|nr:hypothetical protein BGZ95_002781 [Linnemannia exigua]
MERIATARTVSVMPPRKPAEEPLPGRKFAILTLASVYSGFTVIDHGSDYETGDPPQMRLQGAMNMKEVVNARAVQKVIISFLEDRPCSAKAEVLKEKKMVHQTLTTLIRRTYEVGLTWITSNGAAYLSPAGMRASVLWTVDGRVRPQSECRDRNPLE